MIKRFCGALLLVTLLSGCTSLVMHTQRSEGGLLDPEDNCYYPGVRADTLMVDRMFRGEVQSDRWLPPMMLLDLPFSLVMDTLLLPLDALELSAGGCQQGAGGAEKRKAPEGALKIME